MNLSDTHTSMQVLGALVQQPLLLLNAEDLNIHDFDTKITKILFYGIHNLIENRVEQLDTVVVSTYIEQQDNLRIDFEQQNGVIFLNEALEISNPENFDYYYKRLKKLSLLRRLKKEKYDISRFYKDSFDTPKEEQEYIDRFDKADLEDIINEVDRKLTLVKNEFLNASLESPSIAKGNRELKERFKLIPDFGIDLQGGIYNVAVKGARLGKLYVRSAASSVGKTRTAIFDACSFAFPERWNYEEKCFVKYETPPRKTLLIVNEMVHEEIITIIWAFLSGVNEDIIRQGNYSGDEEERVDRAIEIVEKYSDYFFFEKMGAPNCLKIQTCIKRHVLINRVKYVFYDYIGPSISLSEEFASMKVNEVRQIVYLAECLKNLAESHNIFIGSATQLNAEGMKWDSKKDVLSISNAKAIQDSVDIGCIVSSVAKQDLNLLREVFPLLPVSKRDIRPTHVIDIYKSRGTKYKDTRIWYNIDLGTGRRTDLFMTNQNYELIDCPESLPSNYQKIEQIVFDLPKEENHDPIIETIKKSISPITKKEDEPLLIVKKKEPVVGWDV